MKMPKKKKKAVVPRLRFPEFRDAGEWEVKRLGIIAKVIRGSSPRPISQFLTKDDDGFNWLKIGDISNESKYVYSTEQKIEKSGVSKTREVYPGDLILSNSMSFGRPYIMGIRACIHDGWLALTDLKYGLSSEFLYYFILSDHSQRRLHDAAAGGGVRNLNVDIVKFLSIATPICAKEQQKIADCLTSLDDLIRAGEAQLVALKDHKKGLMQQLFPREGETTPRLRFPEFRDAGEWEVKRLGEVFIERKERGGTALSLLSVTMSDGVVLATELQRRTNTNTDLSNYKQVKPNDIVYNSMRMWQGASGVSRLYGVVSPAYTIITPLEDQNSVYWSYHFKIWGSIDRFSRFSQGVTSDTWNLKFPAFSSIQVSSTPLPEEQQKIADCLTSLDYLIRAGEAQLVALKDHKKGLMQQLFPQEVA